MFIKKRAATELQPVEDKKLKKAKFAESMLSKSSSSVPCLTGRAQRRVTLPSSQDARQFSSEDKVSGSNRSTPSSDASVEAFRVRRILLYNRVDIKRYEALSDSGDEALEASKILVQFYINSQQREGTGLPNDSQGDHTIAYVAILLALSNTANSKGVRFAAKEMLDFANSLLGEDGRKALRCLSQSKTLLHLERLDVNKHLLSHPLAQEVSLGLKHSKVTTIANYLCDIGTCFLTEIQSEKLTTFYSKGRLREGGSGDLEKAASRALAAADMLCKICDLDINFIKERYGKEVDESKTKEKFIEKFTQKIARFEESLMAKKHGDIEEWHIARYGFNRWFGDNGVTADHILKRLTKSRLKQKKIILQRFLEEHFLDPLKIAAFMGNLLDYDKKIIFNLSRSDLEEIKENFPREEGFTFSKKQNILTVTRTNEEDLIKVLSRVIKVFSAAFPSLTRRLKEAPSSATNPQSAALSKFDEAVMAFLQEEVVKKGGWSESVDKARGKKVLSAEYLRQKIEKCDSEATKHASGVRADSQLLLRR